MLLMYACMKADSDFHPIGFPGDDLFIYLIRRKQSGLCVLSVSLAVFEQSTLNVVSSSGSWERHVVCIKIIPNRYCKIRTENDMVDRNLRKYDFNYRPHRLVLSLLYNYKDVISFDFANII
jgi:hypothetical protein